MKHRNKTMMKGNGKCSKEGKKFHQSKRWLFFWIFMDDYTSTTWKKEESCWFCWPSI